MKKVERAYKTARARTKPSVPCQWVIDNIGTNKVILDYGCGKGSDVSHLKKAGFESYGFDPHFQPDLPDIEPDLITCFFVLNVIPNREERKKTVARLAELCQDVFVVVRNGNDFSQNWTPYNDGVLTNKGTFQKGIDKNELADLLSPHFPEYKVWTKRYSTYFLGGQTGG